MQQRTIKIKEKRTVVTNLASPKEKKYELGLEVDDNKQRKTRTKLNLKATT